MLSNMVNSLLIDVQERQNHPRQRSSLPKVRQANPNTGARRNNVKGTVQAVLSSSMVHVFEQRVPDNDNNDGGYEGVPGRIQGGYLGGRYRTALGYGRENEDDRRFHAGMAKRNVEMNV